VSAYDNIARLYDPWSRSVVEDVSFYVEEAVRSGGPVLELGVGTGRIAVPVAAAGIEVPFRSLLHMETDADRRMAFRAVARCLAPNGRLVFDVFAPGADDIADTHGRWLEREPGIWERADWNEDSRTLILRVRDKDTESEMSLAWLSVREWQALLREEGYVVDAVYGWFDRSPWRGGEDSVWVCRR
jgi:SAM-dependent methyltransferase